MSVAFYLRFGLVTLLVMGCHEHRSETLAVLDNHDIVIACWQGDEFIDAANCADKEVIGLHETSPTEPTSSVSGLRGRTKALALLDIAKTLPSTGGELTDVVEIFPKPISFEELQERERLDAVGKSTPPANSPTQQPTMTVFFPSQAERVPIGVNLPMSRQVFGGGKTEAALRQFIEESYGSSAYSFFNSRYVDLIWIDLDDDERPEGITMVGYASSDPDCAFDLLVASIAPDGTILKRKDLAEQHRANPCSLAGLPIEAEWWRLSLIPWPGSTRGLALQLDVGGGGGDGHDVYILPLESLQAKPMLAGIFGGWWTDPAEVVGN